MASYALGYLPPPPDPAPDAATKRARAIGQGALTLVGLGTALIALRTVSVHAPPCPFRTLTGVPCPGCGFTRLADAVAHGHVARAAGHDVAGVVFLGALAVLALTYGIWVLVRKQDPPAWMRSAVVPVVLILLVAVHWATTIVSGGLPSS